MQQAELSVQRDELKRLQVKLGETATQPSAMELSAERPGWCSARLDAAKAAEERDAAILDAAAARSELEKMRLSLADSQGVAASAIHDRTVERGRMQKALDDALVSLKTERTNAFKINALLQARRVYTHL